MAAPSLPPLKALRVFEVAARLRSFTAAAEELSITHSAVSQQIRILEEYVGQPLFAREARGVALLPCAQAYFPEVQASLERIQGRSLGSLRLRVAAPVAEREAVVARAQALADRVSLVGSA